MKTGISRITIPIKRMSKKAILPTYGSEFSAGADLYALPGESITVEPGQTVLIHTGLSMEIPSGLVGLVYARSGLATKRDLAPANKVGVIDSDYRGEIMVPLHNHGNQVQTVEGGDRIAQIIFTPYFCGEFYEAEELSRTDRGEGGFGSTGTR